MPELAAGGFHTCALDAGRAVCWGQNGNGQGGISSGSQLTTPQRVESNITFEAVSSGAAHTCGLTARGLAYCWGSNGQGRLGSSGPSTPIPSLVEDAPQFAQLVAGGGHSCAVTHEGVPYCWGSNGSGQVGVRSLGTGTTTVRPVQVEGGLTFQSITVGTQHSCGVTPAGATYCWGDNIDGQLGNGTLTGAARPVLVSGGYEFVEVLAGDAHTCALTADGTAYCWGRNDQRQLGRNSGSPCATTGVPCANAPLEVPTSIRFRQLAMGAAHVCGIDLDGETYCWGRNRSGQLGNGDVFNLAPPQYVLGGHRFLRVAAGGEHSCGVTEDGTLLCWGDNFLAQLGNGMVGLRSTEPVEIGKVK